MDNANTGIASDREVSQWTDDTLPLGVRRELLERELAALIARKRGTHSNASSQGPNFAEPPEAGHPG